jgi:transposase
MLLPFNTDIWLYPNPIDFRKQMDGLIMLVADHLKLNPTSDRYFYFEISIVIR